MRIRYALLAVTLLTGCGGSTAPTGVVGTWTLRQVSGQATPVTLLAGPPPFTVCGGETVIGADFTFSRTTTYGNGQQCGTSSYVEFGTVALDGQTLTLKHDGTSYTYTMKLRESGIDYTDIEGRPYRYTR